MIPGRVLLIDDDPKVLRLLEATLRLKDYDVVKMESGVDALSWLRSEQPDLIISDIMMPDLDGYDFFRRVRSTTQATQVPFIFLSARSEPEDVVKGLRLGADEFLRKPFSIDELLVRVERVLERHQPGSDAPPDPTAGSRGVFDGDLQHMALADVLRMLSVQRKTGLLRVDPKGTSGSGALQLIEGQAVHAEFGVLQGETALFQLLLHDAGRFSFRPGEELPSRTIEAQTLALLMEAFRLIDLGVLRRIDPHNLVAAATLARLVRDRRDEVGPLPRIEDISEPSIPLGMPGLALRLTKGRPPPGTSQEIDLSETSLEGEEFSETVQLDSHEIFGSSDDLPSIADLEGDSGFTQLKSDGEPGPDTWERAGLLTDGAEDDTGLDSAEMAPAFVTDELRALEAELGITESPTEDESDGLAEEPTEGGSPPDDEDVQFVTEISPPKATELTAEELEDLPANTQPSADRPDGKIMVTTEVKAVSLVPDTAYEVPVIQRQAGTDELMDLYERMKVVARSDLNSRAVQLGTRSGRIIASAIREEPRRATVAAFSAQAIAFATEGPSGLQFAVLDAGDLHVVVVEVDHLRLFTVLFDRKPNPSDVLDALRPEVMKWRET